MKLYKIITVFTIFIEFSFLFCSKAIASQEEASFLEYVASQYVLAQFKGKIDDDQKIITKAATLDPRRNYGGKCPNYLTAQLQGNEIKPTSIVKIVCNDPKNKYTVLVPVEVIKQQKVLIASRDLNKGEVISNADLNLDYIDESKVLDTAINDSYVLVGSKVKKNIKAGSQIRDGNICVVCKGEKVNIAAQSGGLTLKTTGLALEDGSMNDFIKIKNIKTGKTIIAKVVGPNSVLISL